MGGLWALLHGVDKASHTIRPHRALPGCNRAGYQGSFLGGDRPYYIALETVRVDDLAGFDQLSQSATGVPMLQLLPPARWATRDENNGILHEAPSSLVVLVGDRVR